MSVRKRCMLFHYPHSVILCVVLAQLIANIELADQFSLSCYLKTRGYQEPELLNPFCFPSTVAIFVLDSMATSYVKLD